ncbi:MAG: LysR family transcriptional regulator [Variovorax sp.]
MGIEFIELETFIAVAQAESFSAAAARMNVTQPTVTGRIQRLEGALGVKLLRRTTRKVETTAQGALLLTEATKALEGLGRLVDVFRKKARLARQRVVVAATPTVAAVRLPPILHAYAERYPDVEIELRDLQYAGVLAALDDGTADVAVLALDDPDARYRFQHLWSDDMLLVAPQGHPLANFAKVGPDELATLTLMVVDQYLGMCTRIAQALEKRGLSLPPPRVVSNLNTLLGMLKAGMGVTLLPRSVTTRGAVAKLAHLEIEGVDMSRQFGIASARRSKLSAAGQSFCRFLRQTEL